MTTMELLGYVLGCGLLAVFVWATYWCGYSDGLNSTLTILELETLLLFDWELDDTKS